MSVSDDRIDQVAGTMPPESPDGPVRQGFRRRGPTSSVGIPRWAIDRIRPGWENRSLTRGASHASAPHFPHCCGSNQL